MSAINIRKAVPADADLIATMSRETFRETFADQNRPEDMDRFMNEQFTHEALAKEVFDPSNLFLLATIDNIPAGYARLRQGAQRPELGAQPAMELARIYAYHSQIGKGVGAALMERSIDIARQQGARILWLGVWEKNDRAIGFYKKWGFEKFAEHEFILGSDVQTDWLMKKEL